MNVHYVNLLMSFEEIWQKATLVATERRSRNILGMSRIGHTFTVQLN